MPIEQMGEEGKQSSIFGEQSCVGKKILKVSDDFDLYDKNKTYLSSNYTRMQIFHHFMVILRHNTKIMKLHK